MSYPVEIQPPVGATADTRPPWGHKSVLFRLAVAVFVVTLLALGVVAERVNNERHLTEVRAATHRQMTQAADRLNAKLHADLQLVRGLVSVINLIPNLDQAQFDTAAQSLFHGHTQLRNIAAAPDMVIRLMHPMAGNERALGLDYRKVPAQRAAAERARDTREIVLAGPLKLVQGGTGLIVRLPIFVPDGRGGERFWGLVSAVLDSERLFRNSGLLDAGGPVEFALRGVDASGPGGAVFIGRAALFNELPAQIEITLPQGSWLLAAAPRHGWPARADNAWQVRLGFAAVALVMLAALAALGRAMRLTDTAQRRAELASHRLALLIEHSPDAMVIVNRVGRIEMINRQAEQLFGWSRAELLGQAPEVLVPVASRADYAAAQARYFASIDGPGPVSIQRPIETRGQHKDGTLLDIEVSLRPLSTEQGTVVTSVIRDVRARKQAEARAKASERRVSVIADHLPVLISQLDREERYLFANACFDRTVGIDHRALIGHTLREARGDAYYAKIAPYVQAALEGQPSTFETQLVIDGQEHFFNQDYVPDVDADGQVQGFYSVSTDVSEQRRGEMRLANSEVRLRMITDNMPALISHIDSQQHFTFANAAWLDFYNVQPQDLVGRHIRDALGSDFYDQRKAYIEAALVRGERVEYNSRSPGPQSRQLRVILIPDIDAQDRVAGMYTLGLDVTAQKNLEEHLAEQARVDHLTGLPNRRGLEDKIEEAAARARRGRNILGVMYVDVDHFKQVNDVHGHAAGDEELRAFAQRLQASVRGTDTVARLGGDEFVVLLEALQDAHEAAAVAEKILVAMRALIELPGGPVRVSASIGIGLLFGTDPALSSAMVLKQADEALYEAKRAGRDRFNVSGAQRAELAGHATSRRAVG